MIQAATATETAIKNIRCAIYCRKSHEEGLQQEFNSLHAQREACEAYIASQRHEGWKALSADYSDGGFTGANIDRPGLQKLMKDIEAGRIDCVVVYKVDRLSRSLLDFARLMATFDEHNVSFVSVTQQFNTTTSMGRLTLNVLLSFAQFEREIIGERIRDKKAAAARKGKYIGGHPFLGYDVDHEKMRLVVNHDESELVRRIFKRFIQLGSSMKAAKELNDQGRRTKAWTTKKGKVMGGKRWNKVYVHRVLTNAKYIGLVVHKGQTYPGEHEAIIDKKTWDRVQAILKKNCRNRSSQTRRKTPALLKGVLRCGHCDKAMGITFTKRRGKRYRYYLCNYAARNGYDTCPVRSVAAGQIENVVMEQLRSIFRSPDVIARTFRAAKAHAREGMKNLQEEKGRIEKRQSELKTIIRNLIRSGGDNGDGFLADELRTLNDELVEVESRLQAVAVELETDRHDLPTEAEVAEALRNIDSVWGELFPAEKERVVKLLVKGVVVNPDGLVIRLRANGIGTLAAEMYGPAAEEVKCVNSSRTSERKEEVVMA